MSDFDASMPQGQQYPSYATRRCRDPQTMVRAYVPLCANPAFSGRTRLEPPVARRWWRKREFSHQLYFAIPNRRSGANERHRFRCERDQPVAKQKSAFRNRCPRQYLYSARAKSGPGGVFARPRDRQTTKRWSSMAYAMEDVFISDGSRSSRCAPLRAARSQVL